MTRIFLFNIAPEKAMRIRLAALRLGLQPVEVAPADFSLPLGALLAGDFAAPRAEEESFEEEMLVMEQLSSPLLEAMRAGGAAVALKAVVTEHNRSWSAARLCSELRLEHEAMRAHMAKPIHRHKKRR